MTSTKIVLSLIASACIATTVSAMEFQVLGARAASMGGAGIGRHHSCAYALSLRRVSTFAYRRGRRRYII